VEAAEHGHQAPGIGADIRHLHSLLRAVGMLSESAGLARISGETVQHAVFRGLRAAGFEAYTQGREAMVRTPVLTRRELSRNAALTELGAYTGISPTRQFGGVWAACPMCGWTMRATYRSNGSVDLEWSNSQYLWIRRCSAVARDSTEVGELVLEVACGNGVEAAVPCGPKYE